MKHHTQTPLRLLIAACCLLSLPAPLARAALSFWDPQGAWGSYSTYTSGSLAGTWENASWSRNYNGTNGPPADQGQATPVNFTDGDAVVFAVGAGATNRLDGTSTTTFTVTMNGNHTIGGFFDGILNPNSAIVTVTGTGTLTLASGLDAFDLYDSSDGSLSRITVEVPMAGPGTITLEDGGQLFLHGVNSFSGGTQTGYSGKNWYGLCNFNNPYAFGTGPIKIVRGYSASKGAFVLEGSSPVTLTNAVDWSGALSNTPYMNFVGNPAGLTFSGPWNLSSKAVNAGSGGAGNLIIISGVISGSGSFTKWSTGDMMLTAAETYTGATTVNGGTLQLGDGATKTCTLATSGITITSPGTLLVNNPTAVTFSKVIGGTGSLTNASSAVQTFSGNNTYTGGTAVNTGSTTKLGNNGGIGKGDLFLGGTLDLNGFSPTVNGLFGTGTVDSSGTSLCTLTVGNSGANGEFRGTLKNSSGLVGLTENGTGTLILGGTSTYSGPTILLGGGTLQFGAASAISPASSFYAQNTCTVDFNYLGGSVASLGGGASFLNLSGTFNLTGNAATVATQNYAGFSCIAGPLSGTANLVKSGTHALALRPTSAGGGTSPLKDFGGTLTLSGGVLSVGGAPNLLPTSYALNVPAGALFELDASSQTVASLNGSGSLNLGGGTLIVNGPGLFSGVIQNAEVPAPAALGNGLRGYYFTNIDCTGLSAVRDDSAVNFPDMSFWPNYSTAAKTNQVSVRWLGQVLAPISGSYYFGTKCDDGARLWVNGQLVVDDYTTHGATLRMSANSFSLVAGTRYDIVMEFFNNTAGGAAQLFWSPPNPNGGNDPTNVIPSNVLFLPPAGTLVKSGSGTLQLTGANTYTGGTAVTGGGTLEAGANALGTGSVTVANDGSTLQLDNVNSLNPAADLVLQGPAAKVSLPFTGTSTIHGLTFDGVNYALTGTWGSTSSGAAHKSSQFTGPGLLNVTATGSTTTLSASSTTPVYGAQVTFTATVTGAAPAPTGTVTFFDSVNSGASTNVLGTGTLSAGTASLVVSNLQVGLTHGVFAVYSGDSVHATSTSSAVSVSTSAATYTPVINIVTRVYDGTTTATIASLGGMLPTDAAYVYPASGYSATFASKDAGTQSVSVDGLALAGSAAGNYTLSGSSFSTTGTITPKGLKVFGITASAKVYNGTTAATINAAGAFLGTAEAVGTGTTSDGTNYIGDEVSVVTTGAVGNFSDPNVANNKTVTITGLTLAGAQAGDYSVINPTTTANITKGASVDNFTASPNPAAQGAPVTLTATLSGNPGGVPTGSIIFAAAGVPFSTNALVNGVASTVTAALPLGTTTLAAWYTGSTNFFGVTNTVSQVINSTCSQINTLLGVTDNGNNTLTLRFQGTSGAQYSVVTNANVNAPIANWGALPNTTTNLVDPNGFWSVTVPKSTTGALFYRSKATSVCP